MENLSEIIESILFVAGEPVLISDIASKLDVSDKELKGAIKDLKTKFSEDSGLVLLQFNEKLQLSTNSKYAEQVAVVLNPIRERNLSKATLETMAIIAYKQPITRLEIEEIRGVGCDYAINILLEHNLIEVVGRKDAVGRPVLFGTTDEFLKRFNISAITELPDYNELLEKIKIVRTKSDSLYNEYDVPTEAIKAENSATDVLRDIPDLPKSFAPNFQLDKDVAFQADPTGTNEWLEKAPEVSIDSSAYAKNPQTNAFNDIVKADDLLSDINGADDDGLV